MLEELRLYPDDFQNYLRMDYDIYNELLELISPLIVKQDTNFRDAITPHERLAATLRYLATGRSYADLKFSIRIFGIWYFSALKFDAEHDFEVKFKFFKL